VVENAVNYGTVARVRLMEGDTSITIEVDDDGPGIREADRDRVFEPFVRLEDSRNRDTGGTGLGLAIARTIARAHGGDVSFANRPEGGLRMTISLPK
jgi:signal transduction histidine kinase